MTWKEFKTKSTDKQWKSIFSLWHANSLCTPPPIIYQRVFQNLEWFGETIIVIITIILSFSISIYNRFQVEANKNILWNSLHITLKLEQTYNATIVTNSLHFWSITTTKYVIQQFHLFLELDTHSLFVIHLC